MMLKRGPDLIIRRLAAKGFDMKKLMLLSAASLAAIIGGGAFAADLPYRKEAPVYVPPPPPPPMWTGFYAGVNLGGGWTANSVNPNNLTPYVSTATGAVFFLPGNNVGGSNAGGVVGGGQIGYNYQFGTNFVVGVETDFQGTSMRSGGNNNFALFPDPVVPGAFLVPLFPAGNPGIGLNWFGTVRGRAGFLVSPTLLVYGTGGFAYGEVQGNFSGRSNVRTGWTAGGGVEWMFMPNWSAKAEYLFTDLSSGGATGPFGLVTFGTHRHPQFNVVRAGVNYHFNFGSAAPVLAKY
jgi:outer membrane immunogenic protein